MGLLRKRVVNMKSAEDDMDLEVKMQDVIELEVELQKNLDEIRILNLEVEFQKKKAELLSKINTSKPQTAPVKVEDKINDLPLSRPKKDDFNEKTKLDVQAQERTQLKPAVIQKKLKKSKKKNPLIRISKQNVTRARSVKKEL